ncbi:YesL family protein [Microbacterium panaciterrae]|uniref:YesL family protein n=1 Tax=Microbacterium panaciterrae TaxID=985759 RepID=A0ABP8PII6_9MICO
MASILAADSALMRVLTRIADLMILNLLFLATSIPLVTLGASLTALHFTALRIGLGECTSVSGDYFRSFRSDFRQATGILGIFAALAVVFAAWYLVVTQLVPGALLQLLLLAVWYLLVAVAALTALYAFPYLAAFEGRTREVLRNARLLSWRHPLASILAVAVIGLAAVVTIFSPQATGYGLAWFLIGFAGIAVVNGVLFRRVFDRYIPAVAPAPVVPSAWEPTEAARRAEEE